MKRLVIAVDCDDVLVSTIPFFVNTYNKVHGTNVPIGQSYADKDVWQADTPLLESRLAALMDTDEYRALRPTQDVVDVLTELAKHHELHVVTSRRENERELTQAMLDRELPGIFTSLEFVGFEGSKGDVCRRLGADILIDDNAGHLSDAIAKGLSPSGVILFGDYPWTKKTDDIMHHCATWGEVQKVIDGRV